MHNIAVLYAEGIDGKPDYKAAVQWFRKAADYGIADSQYNLAVLYARGIGIEANLSESFKWFALAAHSGDQDAAKKRDEIATRLDKPALTAAHLAVQNWIATAAPEEAMTVKPPPGGWEQAAVPAAQSGKPKPRPRGPGPTAAAR
jgi:localization factor PodJL